VLRKDAVPDCRLSSDENEAARLGWSSWLKGRPFIHDADDAVLTG
jgi:type VI secretion system protein ImpH